MRKRIKTALFVIIASGLAMAFLNLPVTSLQGINYQVRAIKMPLYIKLMEFFDRDFQYRQIVRSLINKGDSDENKILAIFNWTTQNIRKNPEGFPVIDDHVFNIIIRGYGVADQSCDVFSTLCNYSGFRSFFIRLPSSDGKSKIVLSLAEVDGRFCVFDPYNGVYFRNKAGTLADAQDILLQDWHACFPASNPGIDYSFYLAGLQDNPSEKFLRSNIQSPLRRIIYEISKFRFFNLSKCHKENR